MSKFFLEIFKYNTIEPFVYKYCTRCIELIDDSYERAGGAMISNKMHITKTWSLIFGLEKKGAVS